MSPEETARFARYLDRQMTAEDAAEFSRELSASTDLCRRLSTYVLDEILIAEALGTTSKSAKAEAEAQLAVLRPARGAAAREVENAKAYKARVVSEATGESARFSALLQEYQKAPEVTRQRLYLEMVEQVLGSSNKVLLDVEGGNNLTYLPLDKIINQPAEARSVVPNQALMPSQAPVAAPNTSQNRPSTREVDRSRSLR